MLKEPKRIIAEEPTAQEYSLRRPFALTTCARCSPSRTARPAESYPLYSSLDSPSNRIGAA